MKVFYCIGSDLPSMGPWPSLTYTAITTEVIQSLIEDQECAAVVVEVGHREDFGSREWNYEYLVFFALGTSAAAMKFWADVVQPTDVSMFSIGIPWIASFPDADYGKCPARKIAQEIAEKFQAKAVAYTGPTGYERIFEETKPPPTLH